MGFNLEETLEKPEFAALPRERKELFINLFDKMRGKSGMEAFSILADFLKQMPKDSSLTEDEQGIMMTAFMESLPVQERARFQNMISMLKGMKR